MTGSHHDDGTGTGRWVFQGHGYPTRKAMCEARRAEHVRLLAEEGVNFTQAAHAVGVSKRTGKAWRNGRARATGRNERASMDWYRSTMDKPRKIHARYLGQEERILIADRLRLGDGIRAIARLPGRDPGAVSREVERNRNPGIGDCEPCRAQQKAAGRLKRPRPRKAAEGTPLWAEILAGLRRHWSPEQIANRPRRRIGRSRATGRGDLITCTRNQSAIGTLVERTTRFTILLHLPDGHDAEHVQRAIIDKMASLPELPRNSLTWDQGAELALHKRITTAPDMQVYFCDPHSPWRRGSNENTNGLPRRYFPKGTDLSVHPEDYLDAVAEELNDRPRKTLGYMKPSEKIIELLDAA